MTEVFKLLNYINLSFGFSTHPSFCNNEISACDNFFLNEKINNMKSICVIDHLFCSLQNTLVKLRSCPGNFHYNVFYILIISDRIACKKINYNFQINIPR